MNLKLSSTQLEAFVAVTKNSSFSKAADQVHITQSALSQRIKNLEEQLGQSLLIRDPAGVRLTEAGEKLLRYCQVKDMMEEEFLSDLGATEQKDLAGTLKIAAYSSILRSVVIPALSPFLRKHPKIQCEFLCKEMHELPQLLQNSQADFIIMDYRLDKASLERKKLGIEEYVMIESTKHETPENLFLDNAVEDTATENFFKFSGKKIKYKRAYMGDCYGIIDGVMNGLGKAVMSAHLLEKSMPIKVNPNYKSYVLDVVLHYYTQAYYPRLHQAVVQELTQQCPKFLKL